MSGILATLEDLKDAIDEGLSSQETKRAWSDERDQKNRKGALELIGDRLHEVVAENVEMEKWATELDAQLQKAKDQIIVLERRLEEAKKTPAPVSPSSSYKPFASIFNKNGVFVIAPLHEVERWSSMSQITKYVLDVSGPNALALCKQFPYPHDSLSDGGYRIQTPSVQVARVLENKIRNMCVSRKWEGNVMSLMSLGTSECIAKDAIRGGGLARMREMCILGASTNISVESSHSEDGLPTGLKISWK